MSDRARVRALVALAVDNPNSEESRTAAVRACQEIHRLGLLGEATAATSRPRFDDVDLNDPDSVAEYVRRAQEADAAWKAEHGSGSRKVRYSRRVFCFRCKSIIEGGEESVEHTTYPHGKMATKYECLLCFGKVETVKLGQEEGR
jgi:hypothetical protein